MENLIDRNNEIKLLSNFVNSQGSTNKIIILSGISGIGKSGLMEKLKMSKLISNDIITVKMSKSSVETIENLQYFNDIYKEFEIFSFNNSSLVPTPTEHGIRSFGNLLRYIFYLMRSAFGLGDAEPLAEIGEEASIIRKKDYIVYLLNHSNIILNIDNIQNIDTQSFELLQFIIKNTKNKTFIFEYTLGEKDKTHFYNFYKELKETGVIIENFIVEKMDFSIAKSLAPKNISINFEVIEKLYDDSQGNLMEIILANEQSKLNNSNINISIKALSIYEKYIIYLIYLHESKIDKNLLYLLCYQVTNNHSLTEYFKTKDLEKLIENLLNKKILKFDSNMFLSIHDSIKHELDKVTYDPILFCAYASIKRYYFENLNKTNDFSMLEQLVFLCMKFSDEELFSLLPRLKELLNEQKYPQLIISKLVKYRESVLEMSANSLIIQKGIYKLTILLIEVCISNKLADEAQKNLNTIFDVNNNYHLALQGLIYSLCESFEVENKLRSLIEHAPINSRLRLILELALMNYCMKMHSSNISEKLGVAILNDPFYKQFKEYAYVLRNYAELCDDNEKAIEYYNKALKIFKTQEMNLNVSSIYISLAMIYAYKGNLLDAKKALKRALSLDKSSTTICYYLNNVAAIDILGNKYDKKTEKSLLDSSLLSVTVYETVLIYCNLLIYYCLTDEYDKASFYAKKIEVLYKDFQYEEFLHIVFQNLYFYYTRIKDFKKKAFYYKKIIAIINNPNTKKSTKLLAEGINGICNNNSFYSNFPFRVDFLGYWEFIIDSDLDHCL